MKKEEEEFISATIEALKSIKQGYANSQQTIEVYPVIKKALPFLVIQMETMILIIDEYIEQFRNVRDKK